MAFKISTKGKKMKNSIRHASVLAIIAASLTAAGEVAVDPGIAAMPVAQWQRTCLPMQETQVRSLGQEDLLQKEMATHSSILAWKFP